MFSEAIQEELAQFELAHTYLVSIEEEICLFFATVFNTDIITDPVILSDDKGRLTNVSSSEVVYYWDDIPVIRFDIYSDEEGYYIEACRLYDGEDSHHC